MSYSSPKNSSFRIRCHNNIAYFCDQELLVGNIIKNPDYKYFTTAGRLFQNEIDYTGSHGKNLCDAFKIADPGVLAGYWAWFY